ncbi:GNAT family N-acetyltransferase [Tsukamurella ocularis]|uniref:GNAT family N-acetyltransferase n=1 Tax=Tsukamurella ocularis TaxID=1970234 RepID=UPI00216734A6|nr:GNAT family N-acetyltransferase [Tsukamurella ocularis]MCS3779860.1 ribosomal protein S18 acetylase RimI-like enzyme [Tsukamurella ocularis]MCS3788740.1 ribosomal protein S18 acetylase RimI-like enzyme [Tsukamurella ocularis]MCS3849950.1 ribosomal protein S18 acetylase RimI-like enzyme [Tsukamurella ocularis]
MTTTLGHVLDDPVRASLQGAHARFRLGDGAVVRYRPDVARFVGHPPQPAAADYAALARLAVPGTPLSLRGVRGPLPEGWRIVDEIPLVQYDGAALETTPDDEAEVLGPRNVDEILDLVARTRPGPFERRTVELGLYLGLRDDSGRLIALAGERLRPPGWTEISAVCTDPAHRGRGLATRLVRAVGHHIRARGDVPFLHTSAENTGARAVYEGLGFRLRASIPLLLVQPPARPTGES